MGKFQDKLDKSKLVIREQAQQLEATQGQLQQWQAKAMELAANTTDMAIPVLVGAGVTGGAYGAGFIQRIAEEKGSGLVGPVPTVAALGIAGGIAAVTMIDDPDYATLAVSVASGAVAGPVYEQGRKHANDYLEAMAKLKASQEKKAA